MRGLIRSVSILAMVAGAAGMAAGPATAQSAFAGKPSVRDVEAFCATRGADKGTVYVQAAVRYPDAARAQGASGHAVRSTLQVRDRRGRLIARSSDRGRAQVDIPELRSYVHVHRHALTRKQSARALGGRPCTRRTARQLRVKVVVRQRLTRAGAASIAQAATQGGSASATVQVGGAPSPPPVLNGCVVDTMDLLDCAGASLRGVSFVGYAIPYANLSFADLTGADFSNVRMGHVTMNKTILDRANMSGAQLGSASLTSASLNGTNLAGAAAPYANFAVASLTGVDLRAANLSGVNLINVDWGPGNTCDDKSIIPHIFGWGCVNGVVAKL